MAVDWTDRGIVLSLRPLGESDAIVTLLTEHQGRHAGLVRGGAGRQHRSVLQPGNLVQAQWRARLESHLGSFTVEALHSYGAAILSDGRSSGAYYELERIGLCTISRFQAHR